MGKLSDLALMFDLKLYGDMHACVMRVAPLDDSDKNSISFLSNPKYRAQVKTSNANAVILSAKDYDYFSAELGYDISNKLNTDINFLVSSNPYASFAQISQYFAAKTHDVKKILAVKFNSTINNDISTTAKIGNNCIIGSFVVIDDGANIDDNVIVGAGCYIGKNAHIKSGSVLYPRVNVYHECSIGKNCIIHSGAVIGSDGFGFAPDFSDKNHNWRKIPQIGIVEIGDDVEIGANTTIDRATFGKTIIGNGCKIDNQVQIAHNVEMGMFCVVAGATCIAGSTKIGNFCIIGGGSQIAGHLNIADKTTISGGTGVMHSTQSGQHITGVFPAMEHVEWKKNAAIIRQLGLLRKKINKI
jgi:UDP-3-O-[3-hydroxymyristoyl] glucosamine N-acyltransferase